MIILMSFLLFIASIFGNKILKLFAIICSLAGGFYSFCVVKLNIYLTEEVACDILGANNNDILFILTRWQVIPFTFLFGILPAIIIYKIQIKDRKLTKGFIIKSLSRYAKALTTFIVISLLVCTKSYKKKYFENIKKQTAPVSVLYPTKGMYRGYQHMLCVFFNVCNKREKLANYHIDKYTYTDNKQQEPVIGIFVIGESLRSDAISANGYKRKTTPFLEEAMKNSNPKNGKLFIYPNVLSCDILTESSVRCLMAKNLRDNWTEKKRIHYKAFSGIFTGLNFDTYFYGLQHSTITDKYMKKFYNAKNHIVREDLQAIDGKTEGHYHDKYLIPHLNNKVKMNTIYVIHTDGNHQPYNTKYEKQQAKWGEETERDEYDTATFAFDEFMQQLIKKFKDANAFIMYTSDHGESFGEINPNTNEETWFHGTMPRDIAPEEQKRVPMIVWGSNKFITNNKDKFQQLQKIANNRYNIHFSHDNIWHSFLDCLNIKSDEIDKKLSICSPMFEIKQSQIQTQ